MIDSIAMVFTTIAVFGLVWIVSVILLESAAVDGEERGWTDLMFWTKIVWVPVTIAFGAWLLVQAYLKLMV